MRAAVQPASYSSITRAGSVTFVRHARRTTPWLSNARRIDDRWHRNATANDSIVSPASYCFATSARSAALIRFCRCRVRGPLPRGRSFVVRVRSSSASSAGPLFQSASVRTSKSSLLELRPRCALGRSSCFPPLTRHRMPLRRPHRRSCVSRLRDPVRRRRHSSPSRAGRRCRPAPHDSSPATSFAAARERRLAHGVLGEPAPTRRRCLLVRSGAVEPKRALANPHGSPYRGTPRGSVTSSRPAPPARTGERVRPPTRDGRTAGSAADAAALFVVHDRLPSSITVDEVTIPQTSMDVNI